MSASNWRVCPRCKKNETERRDKAIRNAEASYGKVPADEYAKQLKAAEAIAADDLEETLREDYGFYNDGVFEASYCASCTVCDYEFKFKHTEKTKV